MRFKNSWIEATVVDATNVANNVRQLKIVPTEGVQFYTVGAHIDVSVMINDAPEIRSYSLVGKYNPDDPYTIAVKRLASSRGGSNYMWTLEKGHKIKISQPTNHFELSYSSPSYLLIAGGIGITPLVGMAEELASRTAKQVKMIYIGTNQSEMPFIPRLAKQLGDNLSVYESDKNGLYDVSSILDMVNVNTQIYLCGPLGLMNAIRRVWEKSRYPIENLRFETFGASGLFAPQTFRVQVPRFGKEITVPANQTLLRTLEAAGIEVMYDCKKGECGLCQVDIVACTGDVDHRDFFFSEEEKGENKKMCACVSRVANGDLVIDTSYRGKVG